MSIFSRIKEWFMDKFPVKSVVKAFNLVLPDMQSMPDLIQEWAQLYEGHPEWLSLRGIDAKYPNLPAIVCYEVARCAASELAISATDGVAQDVIDRIIAPGLQKNVEMMLAQGAVCFRPWFDAEAGKLAIDVYPADSFMPTGVTGGRVTSGVFIDRKVVHPTLGTVVGYTKLELQEYANGTITVKTKAFRRDGGLSADNLGVEIPLTSVPEWAGITPEIVITNVDGPAFVYMASPWAPKGVRMQGLGAAIFADSTDLVEDFVDIYNDLRWEIESGKRAMIVADSAIDTDEKGKEILDKTTRKLYRKLITGGADASVKDTWADYSPEIRVEPFLSAGKFTLGLASLSCHMDSGFFIWDERTGAVTAKEITTKEQKSYGTVCSVQSNSIEPAIKELIRVCSIFLDLYDSDSYDYRMVINDLTIAWGDSIMTDADSERANAIMEVQSGLRSVASYLREFRGLSEAEALQEAERIRNERASAGPIDFFGGT
jgi:A118 family predicted phage portal protein